MQPTQARLFGKQLRIARVTAELNLEQVAEEIGVTISFLSDVERGARPPLTADRINKVAKLFKISAKALHDAALITKGSAIIQVPDEASRSQLSALNALARGGLSDEQWEKIDNILNSGDKQ